MLDNPLLAGYAITWATVTYEFVLALVFPNHARLVLACPKYHVAGHLSTLGVDPRGLALTDAILTWPVCMCTLCIKLWFFQGFLRAPVWKLFFQDWVIQHGFLRLLSRMFTLPAVMYVMPLLWGKWIFCWKNGSKINLLKSEWVFNCFQRMNIVINILCTPKVKMVGMTASGTLTRRATKSTWAWQSNRSAAVETNSKEIEKGVTTNSPPVHLIKELWLRLA